MSKVLIDNSTLTAVQRVLGDITIENKSLIDGDIVALESLIQCILLYDEIIFVDDYKEAYKKSRAERFSFIQKSTISKNDYDKLISLSKEKQNEIRIEKGFFTGDMKKCLEDLQMNTVFTWRLRSSEHFLVMNMLKGGKSSPKDEEDIFKYKMASIMNQARNEADVTPSVVTKSSQDQFIKSNPYLKSNSEYSEDTIFEKCTNLLLQQLSWASIRTLFYLMMARREEADLFLHPIRNTFHLNILSSQDSEIKLQNFMKKTLDSTVRNTYEEIKKSTNFTGRVFSLPIFSAWMINKVSSPQELLNYALKLKEEKNFKRIRKNLRELRNENFSDKSANKLILDVKKSLNKIKEDYHIKSPQRDLLTKIGVVAGACTASDPVTSLITSASAVKLIFDSWNNRDKPLGHLFKSITQDLSTVSRMGEIHEKLTSNVKIDSKATDQHIYTEEKKYLGKSSNWKKPM